VFFLKTVPVIFFGALAKEWQLKCKTFFLPPNVKRYSRYWKSNYRNETNGSYEFRNTWTKRGFCADELDNEYVIKILFSIMYYVSGKKNTGLSCEG